MTSFFRNLVSSRQLVIALFTVAGIGVHLALQFGPPNLHHYTLYPLYFVLAAGGIPLVAELLRKALRREFSSDLLAGISIVTSVILGEYLAGSLVVLMLSGGEALEQYAVTRASSVLGALAKRMPSIAHRRLGTAITDIPVNEIAVDNEIVIFPHEISPVDGVVTEGRGVMDESYLTGEPYEISKTPGSTVLSGSINGENALVIRATKRPVDSRYSQIMSVMHAAEQNRPQMRRLADSLGAYYTPLAVTLAVFSWWFSGDPMRFLAVLVIATPCPLLIAIPVAIIGAISLAAKRGIIIKDARVLEQLSSCKTMILDKTGTLTFGKPVLTEVIPLVPYSKEEVLSLAASVEQYSKHPLSHPIREAARTARVHIGEVSRVSERPGEGLSGIVGGKEVLITSRNKLQAMVTKQLTLPKSTSGLECIIAIDRTPAALLRFHDEPRIESSSFISHLKPRHQFDKIMIVSGDRSSEVSYLAEKVGITDIHAGKSPEEKVTIVREETGHAKTLFIGDGINDAAAIMVATVGVAFGTDSDITSQAAGAVVMDTSLTRVDELLHIGKQMRSIALQSALGGISLSIVGMVVAGLGYLPPVWGAIGQEIIDLFAVLNALRVITLEEKLSDF